MTLFFCLCVCVCVFAERRRRRRRLENVARPHPHAHVPRRPGDVAGVAAARRGRPRLLLGPDAHRQRRPWRHLQQQQQQQQRKR